MLRWNRRLLVALTGTLITFAVGSVLAMAIELIEPGLDVHNPSFELGGELPGWSVQSGGLESIRTVPVARTGRFGVKIDDTSSEKTVGLRSDPMAIQPGVEYRASVWALVESGVAQLYLEFWNAEGTRVGVAFTGVGANAQWQPIRIDLQAPEDAVTATILLYGHRTNVGSAIYDDVELSRLTKGEPHVLRSLPPTGSLTPERPTWPVRPDVGERLTEGFSVKQSGHPRLYVTQAELPMLREKVRANNSFGVNFQTMLSRLETAAHQHRLHKDFTLSYYADHKVTFPLPPVQPEPLPNPPGFVVGRYPYWTAMGSHFRTRLHTLAGAYLFTQDERFAAVAKQDMLALSTWDVWSDPTYNCGGLTCLDTGYIVEGVAFAYDVLFDLLSTEERSTIRRALVEKGLNPLYADTANKVDHNIHMVRTAALGLGALALLGEEPGMDRYLARAYDNFFWYLDQRLDSDATEGMLYTSVSMEHIALFADALERVTGDRTMFDHPYIQHVLPYWILYGYGPKASGLVNFSDSSLAHYFPNTMLAIARVNELPQANWYVASSGAGGDLDRLLRLDPNARIEPPPSAWSTSSYFSDIGWAFLRSGWQANDALFAFLSSPSRMGHNHLDQNHFVLNVGGEWLIKDNGYQDYNPGPKNAMTHQTLGHNAVLINGQGQTTKGGGQLKAAFLSGALDYVAGDASAAYVGTALQGWVRHVLYLKPGYFVLVDEFLLRSATDQPALLIHPSGQVTVDGVPVTPGFSGEVGGFDIRSGSVGVSAQLLWPETSRIEMRTTAGAEEFGPYLLIEPAITDRRVYAATLFEPYSSDRLQQFAGDYQASRLPMSEDSGRSVLRTQDGLLFRAEAIGDRLAVQIDIPVAGRYRLGAAFATAPTYGAVRIQHNGTPLGGVIDTYSPRLGETGLIELGELQLAAGTYTFAIEAVERNEASRGDFVMLQRIHLTPVAGDGSSQQLQHMTAGWSELASGSRVSPADVTERRLRFTVASPEGLDHVWLGLRPADLVAERNQETVGIWTDGIHAWISRDHAGDARRYAMAGGRSLMLDGDAWIEANVEASVSVQREASGRWIVDVSSATEGVMKVRIPGGCAVMTTEVGMSSVLQVENQLLKLPIMQGQSRLLVERCD